MAALSVTSRRKRHPAGIDGRSGAKPDERAPTLLSSRFVSDVVSGFVPDIVPTGAPAH
ncbi:hypothetical protein J5T34_01810 [Cupriavidus gilardii]|uniref:hypothetical protein n=1 Tax=Cupriavidus gilardii TaxID=82541 RepID=UPI001ABDF79D|nr:hypothetical protein [Cupriavidus gilardii]MBO4119471.1 hypothetical protein [Cupriavidus gilardii]